MTQLTSFSQGKPVFNTDYLKECSQLPFLYEHYLNILLTIKNFCVPWSNCINLLLKSLFIKLSFFFLIFPGRAMGFDELPTLLCLQSLLLRKNFSCKIKLTHREPHPNNVHVLGAFRTWLWLLIPPRDQLPLPSSAAPASRDYPKSLPL